MKRVFSAMLGVAVCAAAHGQPVNDDCANAIALANHSVTVWNPAGATADGVIPSCLTGPTAVNMWYSYTAMGAEIVTVGSCGNPNARIGVLSGCGGTEIGCSAGSCVGRIVFETAGPGTYLICAVGSTGSEGSSTLSLDAYPVPAPGSDSCVGATAVVDGDNSISTIGATLDTTMTGPLSCYRGATAAISASPDSWYIYTAPVTGLRNFEITVFAKNTNGSISGSDTKLGIFTACGGSLVACDDDGGIGTLSKLQGVPVASGVMYYIRIANSRFASRDKGVLRISAPTTPSAIPGDECVNASAVTGQPMTVPFSTAGFTKSDARPFDLDMLEDGWFAWTPSTSGVGLVSTCGLTSSLVTLSLYDSCTTAPLTTNQNFRLGAAAPCSPQSRLCTLVEAGHTYWVRYSSGNVNDPAAAVLGSILFDVLPPNTDYLPPANAIAEPGNCDDPFATDVNGGCGLFPDVVPNTFTQVQLCSTYAGVASARLEPIIGGLGQLTADADYYQFTLATDQAVTITGQSEFLPRTTTGIKFNCPAVSIASLTVPQADCQKGAYSLNMTTSVLVAGTYSFMIMPAQVNFASTGDCAKGNRYWFTITGSDPCPPANENCCRGTTCNAVASGACTGMVAGSASITVGSCGSGSSLASCCYADFNHDGTQSIDDLFLYFNAYFTASPWANYGGDGVETPTIDDLFLYINAYFTGCT